jgi:hypothetical protein
VEKEEKEDKQTATWVVAPSLGQELRAQRPALSHNLSLTSSGRHLIPLLSSPLSLLSPHRLLSSRFDTFRHLPSSSHPLYDLHQPSPPFLSSRLSPAFPPLPLSSFLSSNKHGRSSIATTMESAHLVSELTERLSQVRPDFPLLSSAELKFDSRDSSSKRRQCSSKQSRSKAMLSRSSSALRC